MSNKVKNILFRANSSSTIGIGHIMRDLVLASQYKNSKIIFATQNLSGNINHKIIESGYKIKILNTNDIMELDKLIKKLNINILVIDHYNIDYDYEKQLKKLNSKLKIMSLDDTYEKHYCDILLNHNISATKKKYKGLVPKNCELRCGSKYTLLRDEFYITKKKKNIFLAMGGADTSNINISILHILKKFNNFKINLVTTKANKNLLLLKKYSKNKNWIKLQIDTKEIAKLMKESDFAIVTPSVILNEISFMKIPFIAIKTAENQDHIYKYLKSKELMVLKEFDSFKLEKNIKKMILQLG